MTAIDATCECRLVAMRLAFRFARGGPQALPRTGFRLSSRRCDPSHHVLHEILEHGRVELVVDRLSAALGDHEAAGAKHRQMARDRRPARMELIGDFAGGPWTAAQVLEDVAASVVGERAECRGSRGAAR